VYTRRFKILAVIVILVFIYSCVKTRTKTYAFPHESYKINTKERITVMLKDGTGWELRNVHIEENKLIGYTKDNVKKEIDISLIESVTTESKDYTLPFLLGLGSIVMILVILSPPHQEPTPPPRPGETQWD